MFAKPNEIGSAESLTTEIENVAGSLRLNVSLPFEARRYEFSLPAGEEALDGSNEEEVPVLRRVIDTHAGEVIRTTSLPTVIKEVCIARFGGVRNGSEWFSARATLESEPTLPAKPEWFPDAGGPEAVGATDEEVHNAIEEFEAGNEAVLMTDGGRERLPRFCPNDDERLVPREEEPLEVECPECGYSSPRNLRGETVKVCHKKASISENSRGENEAYMATLEIGGIENRIAVTREFVREAVTEESGPETDGGEPVIMTDGGRDIEVREEKYGYLSAACPECGFEIWRSSNPEGAEEPEHHGEDGVRDAVERHLDVCSEFEPIKVKANAYVFDRINEYQADFAGTRSYRVQDAARRQKTQLVIISPEEAEAVIGEYRCYIGEHGPEGRTWMTGMMSKALRRVVREIKEAVESRGYEVELTGLVGCNISRPEPETDGGEEVMTDGGSDEERHEREEQRQFDETFARAATPDDARYIMVCHHCGTCIWRKRDSAVVKRARRNEQPCECGGEFRLIEDARSDEYDDAGELIGDGGEEVMTDGGSDLPRTLRENLIENGNKPLDEIDDLESSCSDCGETFNVAELYWFNRQTFRCSDCHPEVEVMTDGGEEAPESGEESEEPVRWRDWSNVKNERNSERLMTDGGSRVHPDDEGVEILDESNNDDDIIDAGDDGEIIADGGFGDVEEILETIEGFESERFRVRYRLEPTSDEQRFFASGPDDWRISSGVFILRNEDDSAHLSPSQVWDIREIPAVGECPECGSDMYPVEPSPQLNPKNSESGEYCCESCGFSLGPEDEPVVIEYDTVAVNEEELREDNRFKSATFNDHGDIREIARQYVSGGDTFHRTESYRCEECGRSHRSLASLMTWQCEPIPDEEFVRQHTEALTDEAAVERAHELYFEEDAVPPGAKRIDNQLWEFAAMPDPARELIEELESMSGDAGYSGWSVERAGWADHGNGDGHLWVKVEPIEGMYIGGYPEKCGTYSVPQSVINRINKSRFYRVTSVKASTSGEDVGSFRIKAEEDDRLLKLAMLEDAGEVPSIPLGGESNE